MKVNRSTDGAPDWMLSNGLQNEEVKKISGLKTKMSEEDLVLAREEIEKCAKTGEVFQFSDSLSQSAKKDLMEYAEVVGLDKRNMESVSSSKKSDCDRLTSIKKAEQQITSSKKVSKKQVFDLLPEVKVDASNFEKKSNVDSVTVSTKLEDKPSMESSVRAIRGGEKYEIDPVKGVRPGEASIGAPDAIEKNIDSKEKSGKQLIQDANAKREHDMLFKKENWEAEVAASMDRSSILPKKGIHIVESPVSQNHTPKAAWDHSIAKNDTNNMPEKTAGETIQEKNIERARGIQRQKEDDVWEEAKESPKFSVSDVFYESLKKQMKKK